jgi:hypothetical protein
MKINNFTIIGERHTGTNWLESIVKSNFELPVTWEYGWKHWMGFNDDRISESRNTLFLCTTRNPHDWIYSFTREPHHIPTQNKLNTDTFLFNEWISIYNNKPPPLLNKEIKEDRNMHTGERYKNIFELRKVKTEYINSFKNINPNSIVVKYEDMYNNYQEVFSKISIITGITPKNESLSIKTKTYHISDSLIKKINDNICWEAESKQNYSRR